MLFHVALTKSAQGRVSLGFQFGGTVCWGREGVACKAVGDIASAVREQRDTRMLELRTLPPAHGMGPHTLGGFSSSVRTAWKCSCVCS